jgi:hypothetical protein
MMLSLNKPSQEVVDLGHCRCPKWCELSAFLEIETGTNWMLVPEVDAGSEEWMLCGRMRRSKKVRE